MYIIILLQMWLLSDRARLLSKVQHIASTYVAMYVVMMVYQLFMDFIVLITHKILRSHKLLSIMEQKYCWNNSNKLVLILRLHHIIQHTGQLLCEDLLQLHTYKINVTTKLQAIDLTLIFKRHLQKGSIYFHLCMPGPMQYWAFNSIFYMHNTCTLQTMD